MNPGDFVLIGPYMITTLDYRVAVIKGVGQMWRTQDGRYVASSINILGSTRWSILAKPAEYVRFYAEQCLFVPEPTNPALVKFLDLKYVPTFLQSDF